MKISKNNILKLSIFLSIICFFSLNIFSNNTFNRISLDTTQNNLYTISSGTEKFLKNIYHDLKTTDLPKNEKSVGCGVWGKRGCNC